MALDHKIHFSIKTAEMMIKLYVEAQLTTPIPACQFLESAAFYLHILIMN